MNSVKLFGLLLIALTTFERGNALHCVFCGPECAKNTTKIVECNRELAKTSTDALKNFFPELKVKESDKFSCFKGVVTTKDGDKEKVETYKQCTFADVDLCKQGQPKIPNLSNFTCAQCTSDKCNGSSALTQSAIFLVVSYLFVLLSQKM